MASVYESAQKAADPFLDSLASKDPDLVEEGGWIIESSFNRIITSDECQRVRLNVISFE